MVDIPSSWIMVDLKQITKNVKHNIVDGPFGTQLKVHEFVQDGIPVIEMQNIKGDNFINIFRRFITEEKLEDIKRSTVYPDDLIISKTGSLGYIAIVPKSLKKAIITSRLAKVSINWDITQGKYLKYFFIFTRNNGYWEKIARGTTMKILNISHLANTKVPLPPLTEQNRIVEKIEELFSGLDKATEELEKVRGQLKVYRQSVLKSAFEGRLTKEYKSPDYLKLGDLTYLITKGSSPRWQKINYVGEDEDGKVLFITSENVRSNFLDISKPKYVDKKFNFKQKRSILEKGDVLLNIVGASIGRAAIFDIDNNTSNINQAVSLIRCNQELNNKYLSYFLNSLIALEYYNKCKVDVARANLSLKDVASITIPYYEYTKQNKIVQEMETRLSICNKIEESVESGLKKIEHLRQSILKRAFEGKLVPQWTDLPAPQPGKYWVYVVKCNNDSNYIGFTSNLRKRWKQHLNGDGADWTKRYKPKYLMYWEEFDNQEDAVIREKQLKTGYGRKWIKREEEKGRLWRAGETAEELLEQIKIEKEKIKKNAKKKVKA
jgi:restriction endonuclease S subunit/predicted GIY-YIG superfamily endonuclease